MDRDNADYQKALTSVQEFSDSRLIPVQIPWGEKADFKGVIDLLTMQAYAGDGKTSEEIPADLKEAADSAHLALIEVAAEGDDALLEKYLEGVELSTNEIVKGLASIILSGTYVPVFVASASTEIGIAPLLDAILTLLPSPAEAKPVPAKGKEGEEILNANDSGPFALYVWKTTADPFVGKQTFFKVVSGVLNADTRVWNQSKELEERLGGIYVPSGKNTTAVKILHSGDIGVVPKLSETATSNTLCDKAHPLEVPVPDYPNSLYRVSISPKTQADSTKISPTKKQSGGSGQFGEVWLRLAPNKESDFEFKNAIFGGAISSSYMPAIEKGIRNVMKEGVIAGYTVTGITVEVFDGKEHPVDSKPIAFEMAGREAFKKAIKEAAPVLLEPIVRIKITVPDENMGDIMGDMNTRRGRVQGMDSNKGHSTVTANVPLAEVLRYTTDLRSITGGRGIFDLEDSHYEVVPTHVAQGIIDARDKELASKED